MDRNDQDEREALRQRIHAATLRAHSARSAAGDFDPTPATLQAYAEIAAHEAVASAMSRRTSFASPVALLSEAALRAEGAALSAEAWLLRLRALARVDAP